MKNTFLFLLLLFASQKTLAQEAWQVPKQAEVMTNPLAHEATQIEQGKKVYNQLCKACHGINGAGDPVAVKSMHPRPADFTTDAFQAQTDGTIYWKLTKGRGIMAAYENMLNEQQRWQVVNYLRTFKKNKSSGKVKYPENPQKIKTSKTNIQPKNDERINAFPFTKLINAQTTHIMQPKGFGLTIQHRFGLTKFDEGFIQNLMGLDLAANMRFAFEIPVSNKMYFEVGRTRYGKFYDVGAKYLLAQQTANDKVPVSVALYENIAVTTENAPQFGANATFENGDKFAYLFKHRVSYDTQIIISRKFSDKFSAQITGMFIWRNLAPFSIKPKEKNYVIAVPLSLRYKFGFTQAISLELMPNTHHRTMPLSVGYEVASSGNHVFQITITNTDRFLNQNIFTTPTAKYGKDGFILGFNLTRYF